MPRCASCNKKLTLVNSMNCKWCKCDHCISCLPIEVHKCECADECKKAAIENLSNKLENNKTTNSKFVKI